MLNINYKDYKVAFYTLGCKVNQYDTYAIQEMFVKRGYRVVDFDSVADIYVINTCTVTNLSDKKSRQIIRRAKRRNPESILAVIGCYAQIAYEEILAIDGVNLVLGTKEKYNIVDYIDKSILSNKKMSSIGDVKDIEYFDETPVFNFNEKTRAVLKIQDGCDRFCSYCIIPYARGGIRSRQLKDIRKEAALLIEKGYKELVLTGIHLASYGKDLDNSDLIDVIENLHDIDGSFRIRLGSLEPGFITQDFINKIHDFPKLCKHFHLSLQSGSDKILKKMNRRYDSSEYRKAVNLLRENLSNPAITTDIIVGFPYENTQDFHDTLSFAKEMEFSRIHVFKYSERKGTLAASFDEQVPNHIKDKRSDELSKLAKKLEDKFSYSLIGETTKVLFETINADDNDFIEGYSDHYVKVLVKGNKLLLDEMKKVNILKVKDNDIIGTLV